MVSQGKSSLRQKGTARAPSRNALPLEQVLLAACRTVAGLTCSKAIRDLVRSSHHVKHLSRTRISHSTDLGLLGEETVSGHLRRATKALLQRLEGYRLSNDPFHLASRDIGRLWQILDTFSRM